MAGASSTGMVAVHEHPAMNILAAECSRLEAEGCAVRGLCAALGEPVAASLALFAFFRLTGRVGLHIPTFTDGAPRSTTWWGRVLAVFGIVGGAELIRVTGSGDRCPSCLEVSVVSGAVALSRGG